MILRRRIGFGYSADECNWSVIVEAGDKPATLKLSFKIPVGTTAGTYFPYLTLVQESVELSVVGAVPIANG